MGNRAAQEDAGSSAKQLFYSVLEDRKLMFCDIVSGISFQYCSDGLLMQS